MPLLNLKSDLTQLNWYIIKKYLKRLYLYSFFFAYLELRIVKFVHSK